MTYDTLIVGAGFAGSVCARELAEAGQKVIVIDKRFHIGGNAFDVLDGKGVLVHPYGPHIFHTNSEGIFNYLTRFTGWLPYEHRVLAQVDGELYPIPINRTTVNRLYGKDFKTDDEVAGFFEHARKPCDPVRTSEDVVLNCVGSDLCDKFFRGYTRKQWGLDLSELSAGVAARIPTRTNDDDRYFADTYQYMPDKGYTAMFRRMLDHPNIAVRLGTRMEDVKQHTEYRHLVYTGPIDAFFGFRFGKLPYRSLSFEHEHLPDTESYQSVGTVNYPNDHAYTRITEFKHLTGQKHSGTSIVREYPQAEGEPYYPIPRPENEDLYNRYRDLAQETANTTFVGRLAEYRYYNMDQVVGAALAAVKSIR